MIRVVIAEKHEIVREGIKQLLLLAGDIAIAGDASGSGQLIELARTTSPDVVLLNIAHANVEGVDAIARIRSLAPAPAILVLSCNEELQLAARVLKAGVAGVCSLDGSPTELLAAIRKVARGGRYIDPALSDRLLFDVALNDTRFPHARLSEREFQVFERLVRGINANQIGTQLNISVKTVSAHKLRLMKKLSAASVADMVRYAIEHRLI
ncbi:LuxR C-terminal-related transcriptional regulator [Paludibacterium purpuratum]|uniref:LuxR family two component transcriptional regulator n=1 Tax=Paludibacterium purpuratum TaxID=1144873 RepID=A0A4R7B4W1_9NEIS|nr:response regulator transcription factor [Paludibacterium purpuratum]TDR79690.1 LuxR family two component transcriptional regulator [Paludibacterium purpuratum]